MQDPQFMQRLEPSGDLDEYTPQLVFSKLWVVLGMLDNLSIQISLICELHNNTIEIKEFSTTKSWLTCRWKITCMRWRLGGWLMPVSGPHSMRFISIFMSSCSSSPFLSRIFRCRSVFSPCIHLSMRLTPTFPKTESLSRTFLIIVIINFNRFYIFIPFKLFNFTYVHSLFLSFLSFLSEIIKIVLYLVFDNYFILLPWDVLLFWW